MELWVGALNLGFLYALMTMGVFVTFRIHDFNDVTVDGSFTAGAAAAAVLVTQGINPLLALLAAFAIGALAGWLTAFIHTRFAINGLLAGILVMTALYSVNLHIMGRSNLPLLNQRTLFSWLAEVNPGLHPEVWTALVLAGFMLLFWLLMTWFFRTDLGIAMRVTGNNPTMAAANGIPVGRMTRFGVALANGFTGVSGALVAQYQGFADIGMGIGTVVIGMAAVIIGESLIRSRSMLLRVLSVILGAVVFRGMIALALYAGMNPIDLKLLTAVFVLLTLVLSKSVGNGKRPAGRPRWQRPAFLGGGLLLAALLIFAGYQLFSRTNRTPAKPLQIGVVQLTENGLLNTTRDALVRELNRRGYQNGKNCRIRLESAAGELPTVSTILDQFEREKMDIIVTISTGCTQVALNKIRNRPVVFATVANPFLIKAGRSDTEHLANVTGVYGWVPMDQTLELVRKIRPGPIKVGAIWDPAQPNSVFNVENLRRAVEATPGMTFSGATITSSAEVFQAATALAQKGIDAFVLSPDNIVYSAFESVVKAAGPHKIPIFLSDVERLGDGALAVLGYDYTSSGEQAAALVDRILRGEDPKTIPFERYNKLTLGLNLDAARSCGITLSDSLQGQADLLVRDKKLIHTRSASAAGTTPSGKRLALFLFSEHNLIIETARGVTDALRESGAIARYGLQIDTKNAQNELALAQSIAQDIVAQKYDYWVALTTPALQAAASRDKTIPLIFGAVTDPYRAGVAKSPADHLPYLTGVATIEPVEATLKFMRELYPAAKRLGLIWNPGEACSETCTGIARTAAITYGFELIETNVSATSEVADALKALLGKNIDLFLTSGDNTVILTMEATAALLRQHRIPYFTNSANDVERGTLVSVGPDYYFVGRRIARTVERVLAGEKPQDIPIESYAPDVIYINLDLAREYGLTIPPEALKKAAQVILNGKLMPATEALPLYTPSGQGTR